MNIQQYIDHPDLLDRSSLYQLRALTAQYPYYQPARLLLLTNLYLLHDSSFDEELRRAAMYISDRKKLFHLVESAHYNLRKEKQEEQRELADSGKTIIEDEAHEVRDQSAEEEPANHAPDEKKTNVQKDRTTTLIDDFLQQMPSEKPEKKEKKKPTAADAHDYASFLIANETEEEIQEEVENTPQMKGQSLIDDFLNNDDGKMELKDEPEYEPEIEEESNDDDSGFFTETLARIYIKQGRYSKALEIIRRLNLIYPKKNRYFADQIRFLEKLIINNKQNKE